MNYKHELLKALLRNRELEASLEAQSKKFKKLQAWTQKKLTIKKVLSSLWKKEKNDKASYLP